jgi:hypothetical protein
MVKEKKVHGAKVSKPKRPKSNAAQLTIPFRVHSSAWPVPYELTSKAKEVLS